MSQRILSMIAGFPGQWIRSEAIDRARREKKKWQGRKHKLRDILNCVIDMLDFISDSFYWHFTFYLTEATHLVYCWLKYCFEVAFVGIPFLALCGQRSTAVYLERKWNIRLSFFLIDSLQTIVHVINLVFIFPVSNESTVNRRLFSRGKRKLIL